MLDEIRWIQEYPKLKEQYNFLLKDYGRLELDKYELKDTIFHRDMKIKRLVRYIKALLYFILFLIFMLIVTNCEAKANLVPKTLDTQQAHKLYCRYGPITLDHSNDRINKQKTLIKFIDGGKQSNDKKEIRK